MMEFIGRNGTRALFVSEDKGVVVDDSMNIVSAVDIKEPLLASFDWDAKGARPTDTAVELAAAAFARHGLEARAGHGWKRAQVHRGLAEA